MPPTYHKVVDANEMLHKAPILKGCRCFAKTHSLPSPFCMGEGGGGWDSNQIFEKGGAGGGLTEPQFLEEVCLERGGDHYQGGLTFLHKKYTKIWKIQQQKLRT